MMTNFPRVVLCVIVLAINCYITQGEEYLFAVAKSDFPTLIHILSWPDGDNESLQVSGHLQVIGGIENKSIIMDVNDNDTIYLESKFSTFSPLPVSALGRRYIVHFPHPPEDSRSVLVIATYNQTDVDVRFSLNGMISYNNSTYRDGDTLSLRLGVNQTFTVKSDGGFTGTIVETSDPAAVFCGAWKTGDRYEIIAYDQMLPVEHFSDYYAVAVDDHPAGYQLQIISDHNDTQITFNNGSTVSVGQDGVYHQNLLKNQSLAFRTSKPVMTSLYRKSGFKSAFVTIPPASVFRTKVVLSNTDVVKILTIGNFKHVEVRQGNHNVSVDWAVLPNSAFTIGTFSSKAYSKYVISSTMLQTAFTVLMFDSQGVRNCGYKIRNEMMTTSKTTKTSSIFTSSFTSFITTTSTTPEKTILSQEIENWKPYTVGIWVACVFLVITVAVILMIQRKRNVGSKETKHENTLQI